MKLADPSWFFNSLMLRGAGLGVFIGIFVEGIRDGSLNYVESGFMIGVGLMFWFIVAKSARDNTAKAEAYKAYLQAQIRRAHVYHSAFASAIDGDVESIARAEALLSDEVREANEDLELASRIFYAASRAAEREVN